jgi:RNA polymerase sigma factor (sigma-70 family)
MALFGKHVASVLWCMTTNTNTNTNHRTIVTNHVSRPVSRRERTEHGSTHRLARRLTPAQTSQIDIIETEEASQERCLTEAEYAQAFQTHFRKTLRFLRSRGASEDMAEEVAQEAWARGWERLHQLRNPEVVDVWVNSIAKHLWRNRVVRDQRNRELTDNMAMDHNPDGSILWQQITQACGAEEQKLLTMHYVRGYTSGEIAKRLGSTALAIRLRLMRTRRKLEQLFDRDLLLAGA